MTTVAELKEVRAYVLDRIEHRSFAEHPEDRVELIHKAQVLDRCIKSMAGYPLDLQCSITFS